MKTLFRIALLGCFLPLVSFSQEVLTYDAFMKQVIAHHPIMQQADLAVELGNANLALERAVMDPYVEFGYGDKAYDDKDYYDKTSLKLALPTALGVELFTGYSQNTGPLVNPEISTSTSGQYQAGISLPIGSNLLLNERQMAIRQGKLMASMAVEDRRIILNNLLFRANLAYLNWALAQELLLVQQNAIVVAREQFSFIKEVYIQGDRPAIDTTEAFLQVQNRTFRVLGAENTLNTAELILSTFLWSEDGTPLGLAEGYQPEPLTGINQSLTQVQDSFLVWSEQLTNRHPDLIINQLGIEALKIERQTTVSNMLPQLDFKYAVLTPGVSNRDINAIGLNDRMLGVGFKYPLLLRKERNKLSLVNIKTLQKTIDLDVKQLELRTKLDQVIYDYQINAEQSRLYLRMTENYSRLLEAEKTKFAIGESSVFLLNSRENKLFEAQEKLLETQAKQATSALKVIQTANREQAYLNLLD